MLASRTVPGTDKRGHKSSTTVWSIIVPFYFVNRRKSSQRRGTIVVDGNGIMGRRATLQGVFKLHAEVHDSHQASGEARSDAVLSEIPGDFKDIALSLETIRGRGGKGGGGLYALAVRS